MRIAVPVVESTSTLAETFSQASLFALYDVHDETRAVAYLGRQSLAEPCRGATPVFLKEHGVEVVMAHTISENAQRHLKDAGIVAIKDAPQLTSDALIAHLVSGTLQATPPESAQYPAGQTACGSGGCGHCTGGGHAHEAAEAAKGSCDTPCH